MLYAESCTAALCVQDMGVRSQCVQYAIPLQRHKKRKLSLCAKGPTIKKEAQADTRRMEFLSENVVIYRGESAVPGKKSADAGPLVQRDGHAFFRFVYLFVDAERREGQAAPQNMPTEGGAAESEAVPEEDCQAGRETVCNRVLSWRTSSSGVNCPILKEGAQCRRTLGDR